MGSLSERFENSISEFWDHGMGIVGMLESISNMCKEKCLGNSANWHVVTVIHSAAQEVSSIEYSSDSH